MPVIAVDSSIIDLSFALCPWANWTGTDAAVKLHAALDLRGPIPTKHRLAVKIEDKTAQIALNNLDSFPFPASFKMCSLQIAYEKTGAWELAYDTYEGIKRKQREIALVCDNPNPPTDTVGPLFVNVIKDRIPLPNIISRAP